MTNVISGRRVLAATITVCLLAVPAAAAVYIELWLNPIAGYTRGLAVHSDGRSFIGKVNPAGTKSSIAAFDADGKQMWSKVVAKRVVGTVGVTPDGETVIIIGSDSTESKLWIGTLNTAKGKKGWDGFFDLDLGLDSHFSLSVSVAPDGECFFVGGTGFVDGIFTGFVAKVDIDGNLLWAAAVEDPDGIEAVVTGVVADTRSDGVFFTGWFGNPEAPTLSDAIAGRFDGNGTNQWVKISKGSDFERGNAIVLDPKGKNLYIAGGSSAEEGGGGVLVMRVTSKGKIKWARRVDTDWFRSVGWDLEVSAKGKTLHIVGQVDVEGFGVGAGLMLMTNNKGKKPSWDTMQPEGTEDTLSYDHIGRAADGTYRIYGGRTDGVASLGSYTE